MGDSWLGGEEERGNSRREGISANRTDYTLEIPELYLTGDGNAKGPNRTFCASAVAGEPKGPFPVLFFFHGGGGHASGALTVSVARRNPGFAAVAVDYNGQFRPSKAPATQWVTLTERLRARRHDLVPNPLNFPMYHSVQTTRRVIDWAQDQPWVDDGKLGDVGISYGGCSPSFLLA